MDTLTIQLTSALQIYKPLVPLHFLSVNHTARGDLSRISGGDFSADCCQCSIEFVQHYYGG